jgi:VWFA-related protein
MSNQTHLGVFLATLLAAGTPSLAQPAPSVSHGIPFNVVVTSKSGEPIYGLQPEDFRVLDNKTRHPITSFKEVHRGQEPVSVILVIDAVNSGLDTVNRVRQEIKQNLLANGGSLTHPTMIAVLTNAGSVMNTGFSSDGKELGAIFDHYTLAQWELRPKGGLWAAEDRFQISLTAVRRIADFAATVPGRKIVLWLSPGWPLLSGAGIRLDSKQQNRVFNDIVTISTKMREADITLYNINPSEAGEGIFQASFYRQFVNGIADAKQTELGDLSLQVLAVQSGGLTINASNDVTNVLNKCLAETESWYEITVDSASAEQPNEYHHIEIKLDKPNLSARTRDGYYAQP